MAVYCSDGRRRLPGCRCDISAELVSRAVRGRYHFAHFVPAVEHSTRLDLARRSRPLAGERHQRRHASPLSGSVRGSSCRSQSRRYSWCRYAPHIGSRSKGRFPSERSWTLSLLPQGPIIGLSIVLLAAALALWAPPLRLDWFPQTALAKVSYLYVVATCVLAFLAYIVSYPYGTSSAMSVARNRLSRWLGVWLVVFLMLLAFALVDTFGQTAYALWTSGKVPVVLTGVVTSALVLLARQFAGYLTSDKTKQPKGVRIPMHLVGSRDWRGAGADRCDLLERCGAWRLMAR